MVALLAEGVDRNPTKKYIIIFLSVALLAEGVDRNRFARFCKCLSGWSPSSRRAWIEIESAIVRLERFMRRPPRGGRG